MKLCPVSRCSRVCYRLYSIFDFCLDESQFFFFFLICVGVNFVTLNLLFMMLFAGLKMLFQLISLCGIFVQSLYETQPCLPVFKSMCYMLYSIFDFCLGESKLLLLIFSLFRWV